jgi:uncharacterized SAM-binding protein YcdF (DUF218 family)
MRGVEEPVESKGMLRLIWWLGRLLVAMLVLGVGAYIGGPYLLTMAGRHLVTEQPLAKADLVLVLSGQIPLRIPEGARIYHEGYAPKILLTNELKERGSEDLLRLGIRIPDTQERAISLLEALRVPRSDILTIQERGDSTRSEMQTVARFLKSHPVKRMIIVTSKSHTTRAYRIFSAGLGPGVLLIMHPVPNDPFDPTRWWHDRLDAKEVVYEYEALADSWRMGLWATIIGEFATPPPPVTVR